ncbi:MAG: hypothetical protein H7836_02500 [Magnetococcus sp. YQC-3]
MTATLIGLLLITALLQMLLHLRRIRESSIEEELPSDKITVLIGIYLMLSKGCIQYYRDYGRYPDRITGDSESLVETGYLKGEPLASMSKSIPKFSIVSADVIGYAICLPNTKRALASDILTRLKEMESSLLFVDMRGNQFLPLALPIPHESVNLCLMLPKDPTKPTNQAEAKTA